MANFGPICQTFLEQNYYLSAKFLLTRIILQYPFPSHDFMQTIPHCLLDIANVGLLLFDEN
jgi:hypothetical protein